ncbi:MAG: double-strand break repair protein AddB [Xanthobacteraceae bacterium]
MSARRTPLPQQKLQFPRAHGDTIAGMIPRAGRPRIFTIPPSADFLPVLIRALIGGDLVPGFATRDPIELAHATIYLPTRRACRLAREAFLAALDRDAAVLPRIVPLGDIDEDEFIFVDLPGIDVLELKPTIGGLERRALLAQLILKWAASAEVRTGEGGFLVAHSPAAALALADDLVRLMDDMTTRQIDWKKLDKLVPDEFDRFWQSSLKFLKIARETWPAILADRGSIEPAEHRDKLIALETTRLAAKQDGPVIVAGSTGSMPATAQLIAAVAKLPHGAVVLPGLDLHLDEDSWRLLAGADDMHPLSGHPQFAMQALLTRMEVSRSDIVVLGETTASGTREKLISEALRPAETTDRWQQLLSAPGLFDNPADGLHGISVIEAAHADEEALAIAIALRESLETPGKTAALVTPDRALARRVVAALGRWNVVADDSGGDPLGVTPAGTFARLAAHVALEGLAPVPLLALLKHPLLRLGKEAGAWSAAISALERAVLRGPRPRAGSAALVSALTTMRAEWEKLKRGEESDIYYSDARASLTATDFDAAGALVDALATALAPLEQLTSRPALALSDIAAAHEQTLTALSEECFAGDDGAAVANIFGEITALPATANLAIAVTDYAEMFETAIANRMVRGPGTPGARVRIYGLLEARLTHADRVILGGLVEGAWPPETRNDPWLNRPMRHQLGLDLPERRVGLAAHDFAQLLGASEVILTRSAKLGGAPTIASRFMQRLAAVAGERWNDALAHGEKYLRMARDLDQPEHPPKAAERPSPKPPRAVRPASLSVTEIETWLRDPYSIYAKHILRLRPLDAIDEAPGARDRGTMIHGAIGDFGQAYKDKLPDDVTAKLIEIGEKYFAPLKDHPEARAFWWPRFLRVAHWFAGFEAERRANLVKLDAEISGALKIAVGDRVFMLRARADRIEHLEDGRYALIDYKTGTPPTASQVKSGLSPQLTLEGAILRSGEFAGIAPRASIAQFLYVGLRGGDPPGIPKDIAWDGSTPDIEADTALRRLTELVSRFEDEAQPYLSRVTPMFIRRSGGDYDHLARIKEWSLAGGAEDDDGGSE